MTAAGSDRSQAHEIRSGDDPLADALHSLRMDGMFYCRSELTAPWGIDLPPMSNCLWFHVVTSGECVLADSNGGRLLLRAGDIVVLPHGAGHRVFDGPGSPTPVVFDLPHHYISRQYAILRHGGGGEETNLICGVVRLGHPAAAGLLAVLPKTIHIEGATRRPGWHWLAPILALMAEETRASMPGGETVVTRLCDVLVIQAIRSWIDTDPAARQGWLGALRDPTIGRSISLIHADPARDWTVKLLAAEVGMSRSGFSARFTELVGQSPKRYVTGWRMQVAEDMLRTESTSILTIATQLGYRSEAAFSRAFSRETGFPPSHVRRRRQDMIGVAGHVAAAPGPVPPAT